MTMMNPTKRAELIEQAETSHCLHFYPEAYLEP